MKSDLMYDDYEYRYFTESMDESMERWKRLEDKFKTDINKEKRKLEISIKDYEKESKEMAEGKKRSKIEHKRTNNAIIEYEAKLPHVRNGSLSRLTQEKKIQLESLNQKNNALAAKRDELLKALEIKKKDIENGDLNNTKQKRLDKLELNAYIHATQFEILHTGEDEFQLLYKAVNRGNPKDIYSCTLKLHETGYSALKCTPNIPDLQALVDTLNADRDFYAFLKRIRNSFQDFN